MYLIYLDDDHLDDLLFVPSLAQRMGRMQQGRPLCLFVHGCGEQAERILEAEGLFPEHKDGLLQGQTPGERALVERAHRQVNRRIVGALTEEGVPAVGFLGADRGLLRLNEAGVVTTGRVSWLRELTEKGAVPVVSALVQGAQGGQVQIQVSAVAVTLARALQDDDIVVVFFTRNDQPGLVAQGERRVAFSIDAMPDPIVSEPEAVRSIVAHGFSVLLTNTAGLFSNVEPQGTHIIG